MSTSKDIDAIYDVITDKLNDCGYTTVVIKIRNEAFSGVAVYVFPESDRELAIQIATTRSLKGATLLTAATGQLIDDVFYYPDPDTFDAERELIAAGLSVLVPR